MENDIKTNKQISDKNKIKKELRNISITINGKLNYGIEVVKKGISKEAINFTLAIIIPIIITNFTSINGAYKERAQDAKVISRIVRYTTEINRKALEDIGVEIDKYSKLGTKSKMLPQERYYLIKNNLSKNIIEIDMATLANFTILDNDKNIDAILDFNFEAKKFSNLPELTNKSIDENFDYLISEYNILKERYDDVTLLLNDYIVNEVEYKNIPIRMNNIIKIVIHILLYMIISICIYLVYNLLSGRDKNKILINKLIKYNLFICIFLLVTILSIFTYEPFNKLFLSLK